MAWTKTVPRSGGMQSTSLDRVDRTQRRKESSRPTTEGDDEKWLMIPTFSDKKTEVWITQLDTVRAGM